MDVLHDQPCPMCVQAKATLVEDERDIAYFGKVFLFSLTCKGCGYHTSDVESAERKDPLKCTFVVSCKDDLNARVVKSSSATVKVPTLRMSVEPGTVSKGYVSNVEGLLNRFKKILEGQRDSAADADARKKAKNLLKKMRKIENGDIECKIVLEDPTGNSAIISEKAQVATLKVKKK